LSRERGERNGPYLPCPPTQKKTTQINRGKNQPSHPPTTKPHHQPNNQHQTTETKFKSRYPDKADGRIRLAKVDCTAEAALCRAHFISAFPSLRVFRRGHDDLLVAGMREHEAYTGDRTKEALVAFADSLVPSAGSPHTKNALLTAAPRTAGCNLAGFALVKKVPGTLHFTARAEGHSFDHAWMNLTHAVHSLYFGARPTQKKFNALKKLHPAGLSPDWLDKMGGSAYFSDRPQHTHEHWLSVVLTSIRPLRGGLGSSYDAYEYNAVSNTFVSDSTPSARFSYGLSPVQVVVSEKPRQWCVGRFFSVSFVFCCVFFALPFFG